MINSVKDKEKYKNMITTYDNKTYVNGSIAYYGGGKNYSVVTQDGLIISDLESFEINFDELTGYTRVDLLKLSAGVESFRFLIYTNSSEINLEKQISDFNSGEAYSYLTHLE